MKLSTKSRYAITAIVDLANSEESAVSLKGISDRQKISLSYLEQLFCKLKNSGIVKSQRGPGGGYKLGRDAQDITLLQIITAVDENIDQTQCGGSLNCNKEKPCSTHHVWTGLNKIIYDYMNKITIGDVANKNTVHEMYDAREGSLNVN